MGTPALTLAELAAVEVASAATRAYYAAKIYYSVGAKVPPFVQQNTPQVWRPPQWASKNVPALTMSATEVSKDPDTGQAVTLKTIYVFDGAMHADHEQQSVVTLNPVQNGAPIADHAYTVPPRLTVELLMSDSMQSYVAGQWMDTFPRSVAAYQTLLRLQRNRIVVQVATRMNTYDNALITEVRAVESHESRYSGKFFVTFTQFLTANVEMTSSDFKPITANDTNRPQNLLAATGTVATAPTPQSASGHWRLASESAVPAAGHWTSSTPPEGLGTGDRP